MQHHWRGETAVNVTPCFVAIQNAGVSCRVLLLQYTKTVNTITTITVTTAGTTTIAAATTTTTTTTAAAAAVTASTDYSTAIDNTTTTVDFVVHSTHRQLAHPVSVMTLIVERYKLCGHDLRDRDNTTTRQRQYTGKM